MQAKRNPLIYFGLTITVVMSGLSTRYFAIYLPKWVGLYLGDCLWALMIFLIVGRIFRTRDTKWITVVAVLFCYLIEASQLYHSEWIDIIRNTRIGGLVLGRGFLWSDLISYSIGVALGTILDRLILYRMDPV